MSAVDIDWNNFSPEILLDEALRKGYSPIISQCQTRSQRDSFMTAGCSANFQSYLLYYILKKYFRQLLFFPKISFLFLLDPSRKVHEAYSCLKGYIETGNTIGKLSIIEFLRTKKIADTIINRLEYIYRSFVGGFRFEPGSGSIFIHTGSQNQIRTIIFGIKQHIYRYGPLPLAAIYLSPEVSGNLEEHRTGSSIFDVDHWFCIDGYEESSGTFKIVTSWGGNYIKIKPDCVTINEEELIGLLFPRDKEAYRILVSKVFLNKTNIISSKETDLHRLEGLLERELDEVIDSMSNTFYIIIDGFPGDGSFVETIRIVLNDLIDKHLLPGNTAGGRKKKFKTKKSKNKTRRRKNKNISA